MSVLPWAAATISFLAAALALTGVLWTVRQKDKADRRAEWWRRAAWALERTMADDDPSAELGWAVVDGLVRSGLATDTEEAIIEAIAVARISDAGDTGHESSYPDFEEG